MKTVILFFVLITLNYANAQDFSKDTTIRRIEKMSSQKNKAIAYNDATESAWKKGNLKEALEYSSRGLAIAKEYHFSLTESKLHNNRGITYDYLNQYPAALNHYFEGLSIQEKLNDPYTKANLLGNIGLLYSYQNSISKSMNYHKRALSLRRSINDQHGISASLNNIAILYARQGKFSKSIENYLACIEIDSKAKDTTGLGDDYNNIALIYLDLKQFDTALEYLQKSLVIRTTLNNRGAMAITHSNIGELYYLQGNYTKAKEYFLTAASLGLEVNDKECLKYVYSMLQKNAEKSKDSLAAYRYFKLYISYRDSIDNSSIARKQTELELNYQFNKEKEVSRLREQEKDRQYFIILIAISSGLILILLFSILFFRKWKQTQRQQDIIEEKNALVQQKNDEILASINYAKRIQKAIFPSNAKLDENFPSHFVLYLPKDIVSGDFYWMDDLDETTFLAVADCTGHGVPGALMSVVCHNSLNRALREFGKTGPADILDKTRELVIQELSQHEDSVADGMDISLCAFNKKMGHLAWAGANNPLWIYRQSSKALEEWKADKQPIGNHQNPSQFTEHMVEVKNGDRIYLFSDGYQDQFGGPVEKKMMSKGFRETILSSVHLPIHDQQKLLLKRFYAWQGGLEQLDDVCVMCVEIQNWKS